MACSPLLKLPPELRNRIYELVFLDQQPQNLLAGDHPATRTCRQIRSDSIDLFYSISNFRLVVPCIWTNSARLVTLLLFAMMVKKTSTAPQTPRHIRRLQLSFQYYDCGYLKPRVRDIHFTDTGELYDFLKSCGVDMSGVTVDTALLDHGKGPRTDEEQRRTTTNMKQDEQGWLKLWGMTITGKSTIQTNLFWQEADMKGEFKHRFRHLRRQITESDEQDPGLRQMFQTGLKMMGACDEEARKAAKIRVRRPPRYRLARIRRMEKAQRKKEKKAKRAKEAEEAKEAKEATIVKEKKKAKIVEEAKK